MAEWFKDWFSSAEYLNIYRHRDDKDATDLFELIIKNSNLKNDSSVLDVCCGAGRHSILFAKKGFNVTGFDLSKFLLNIAKENSKDHNLKIDFFCADQRKFLFKNKFDLILNLFTSFGYFENDEENFLLFENAFRSLKENGTFVFDYFNSEYLKKNLIEETISNSGNEVMIQKRSINSGRVEKDILIKNQTGEKNFKESVRLYTPDEIFERLEKTGFKIRSVFGNYSGEKFDTGNSTRLIIFAGK